MVPCSVYFVECGFPEDLPGFNRDTPAASFPYWGQYSALDFAIAAFSALGTDSCRIVAEPRFRGIISFINARPRTESEQLSIIDSGIDGLLDLIEKDPAETVLFSPLHLLCDPDADALRQAVSALTSPSIQRISIRKVETDIYLASKRTLIEAVKSYRRKHPLSHNLGTALFTELLHASFESIRDIPGRILFQNNLTQLFKENLRLVGENGKAELLERLKSPAKTGGSAKGALIDRCGHVRNSLIAAGTRIEGYVEGSFIFPGVVVHRGASVVNSVVMNGNRIGSKARLYKTLVLPYVGELGTSNVGESASIGMIEAGARNFDFPKQIREGVTVIGMNVEIPKGMKIGSGSLVGARVGAAQLRSIKELPRSSTVRGNQDQDQE